MPGFKSLRRATVALFLSFVLMPVSAKAENFFQGAEREQAIAEIARLREIQQRYLSHLHALPGVIGAGIGLDREARRLIFNVMIGLDSPPPELPADLEGVPLRVVRQAPVSPQNTCTALGTACHADLLPLPVEMGNTAHTQPVSVPGGIDCHSCSLGFKACDVETGEAVYVTAAHCSKGGASSCAGSAAAGDPTYHRSPKDSATPTSCPLENVIGGVSKQRAPVCGVNNTVEAASVVSDAGLTQISIRDIGTPSAVPGSVIPGDDVQKSGRTTGYTLGTVTDVAASVTVILAASYCNCLAGITFVDQIRIENAWGGVGFPIPAAVNWTKEGDSGSAVLTMGAPPEIVGLNVLGDAGGSFGYANPIDEVMAQLDLSLNLLDCAANPCAATEVADDTSSAQRTLRTTVRFRDEILSRSDRGRTYIRNYYRFTGDIVRIMRARPALMFETARLYDETLPLLESVLAGTAVTMKRRYMQRLDRLITKYQAQADNPGLKRALVGLRRDLRRPQFLASFGISIERGGRPDSLAGEGVD